MHSGQELRSVQAAVRMLKLYFEGGAEIGISEMARRLTVAKSTAHRLAGTLVREGMLERNPESRRYRLGPYARQMAGIAMGKPFPAAANEPAIKDP